jgi:CO/xanthine dehydrogenase FAD-binding subunit
LQEFLTPENEAALLEQLRRHDGNALIVGGGTFVHGLSARGLLDEVRALIDIQRLGLGYVRPGPQGIAIGATATFAQLEAEQGALLAEPRHGALRDALAYPPVQIRNTATFGGCVAASCPYFDVPVGLLALDAAVQARGPGGARTIRLEDFFTGLFENALQPGEFVAELTIPSAPAQSTSAFMKLETNANDLAILNAAVFLRMDGGRCAAARVFVSGGVGETPVRARSAEAALAGKPFTPELAAQAGKAAQGDVEPMSDHRASAAYRRAMTAVLVERALRTAFARLK